jgi:hypothetical protein
LKTKKRECLPESKISLEQYEQKRNKIELFEKESLSRRSVKGPRQSPLQDLDPNISKVRKDIGNIDKLQSKIRGVLGLK